MGASAQGAIQVFKKEIYKSRCIRALTCVIACHLVAYCVAIIFLATTNTSIASIPGHWWSLLHPTSWLYLAILVGLTCAMGFQHAAWYTIKPITFSSWLSQISKLASFQVVGSIISHMIISAFVMRSYLGLFGSRKIANLFEDCQDDAKQKCVNEWHLFLICQAAFSSIFCSISYFVGNNNLVNFPIIQQLISERVTNTLRDNFWRAMMENLQTMKWFYLFYLLQWGWLCDFLTDNLDVQREGIPVDSVLGLFNLPLFFNAFILGTLSRFVFQSGLSIFEISHTESLSLEMVSQVEATTPLVLTASLEAADCPLLQSLAFAELADKTCRGAEQRAPAFRLSQPGGHPHTWTQVSSDCLTQITGLTQRLEAALSPAASNNNNDKMATTAAAEFRGMRDLAAGVTRSAAPAPAAADWSAWLARAREWAEKRPLIGALVTEPADVRVNAALATGGLAGWSVRGLTALAVASLTEDKFGVAQRQLPALFHALLTLSTVLERARRLSAPGRCATLLGAPPAPPAVTRMAAALRAEVGTALFRLTGRFGPHLRGLGLDAGTLERLEPYRLYAEG